MTSRFSCLIAAASIATAALLCNGAVQAQEAVRLYPLPDAAAYPEGIAADPSGKIIYSTNIATGAIFATDLGSGSVTQIGDPFGIAPGAESGAPGRSFGAKVDGRGRMWIAGGLPGTMHVFDLASRKVVAKFSTPGEGGLINDVALTADAAYFTDTRRPFLWRVPLDAAGDAALQPWIDFTGTALQYTEGANLNGIAATADGRYLVVVQMAAGKLFRIDTRSREVTRIDVGDEMITLGDGLVLDRRRLYLVRQGAGEVVALDLSPDFGSGKVVARIKPAEMAWPSTAALVADRLIIANSQLNQRGANTPVRPFTLASVPLSAFQTPAPAPAPAP